MEKKIAQRRLFLSFSEDTILRKSSVGKDPALLTRKDYKSWFVKTYWNNSKGVTGGVEVDCSAMNVCDVQNFILGMHK